MPYSIFLTNKPFTLHTASLPFPLHSYSCQLYLYVSKISHVHFLTCAIQNSSLGTINFAKKSRRKGNFLTRQVKLLSNTYIVQPQVIGEEYFGVSWVRWGSVPHQEKRFGKSLAFKELDCVISTKGSNEVCCVHLKWKCFIGNSPSFLPISRTHRCSPHNHMPYTTTDVLKCNPHTNHVQLKVI